MLSFCNWLSLYHIASNWVGIYGSNWAQLSGEAHSNSLIVERTTWAHRHGHAVATFDSTQDAAKVDGRTPRLFLIGGDSSTQTSYDLRAYPGGGALRNDVWILSNIEMEPMLKQVRAEGRSDTVAQTIVHSTWTEVNGGRRPPDGVTYDEWIACALNPWVSYTVEGCNDLSNPPGMYLADIMFSPRRNFAAVVFKDELFILGGRARDHRPLPQDQLRGGVRTLRSDRHRWREYAVLKNDVWKSKDNGVTWKLVTPGCKAPQANLVHKNGDVKYKCQRDSDCERGATCTLFGNTTSTCTCNMWSPREYHSVSVFNNAIYLSGGYANVQQSTCGSEDAACGGGYRAYMQDVWRSVDGANWEALNVSSAFPERGEHTMTSFQGSLYIMGGRTGNTQSASRSALLNDIWKSTDGALWTIETSQASWSPRAKHSVLVVPGDSEELLLMFGESEEGVLGDVWSWKGGKTAANITSFIQDFSSSTPQADYVHGNSGIRSLKTMTEEVALIMNAAGIDTIQELASISFDTTIQLRQQVSTACDFIFLAKYIQKMCDVSSHQIDFIKVEESSSIPPTEWDGCSHHGKRAKNIKTGRLYWPDVGGIDQVEFIRDPRDDAYRSTCRWNPPARTGQAAVVFQGKPLVLGGLLAANTYDNDVWFRIAELPKAQFTLVPRSHSSDTLFQFVSDAPGCTFQYHVLDLKEKLVVRGWTSTLSNIDYSKWLRPGLYRFRVRAVDPSGNADAEFENGRNEHIWKYNRKIPYALIFGLLGAFLVICIGSWMEWKKWKRRKAMERYALQRLRRKKSNTSQLVEQSDRSLANSLKGAVLKGKYTLKKDTARLYRMRPNNRILATG
ncbi:hypothetical protein ABG067_003681 [Albugo candida]